MNNFKALDILQECINELNTTTKEQFDNNKKKMGINNKIYNREEYINDEVEILFDLDQIIDVQSNDLIWECENEFINLSLFEESDYNIYKQSSSIVIESNYISNEQTNIVAIAA